MNKLSTAKRAQIIGCLVEGNSLRATARMCDVAFNTVLKFIPEIGEACDEYQDKVFRNLKCKRIQCDEIWSFCYAKEKNVPEEKRGNLVMATFGHGWLLTQIQSLFPRLWLAIVMLKVPKLFMDDLASRLANRVQLTTDGHRVYLDAVEDAFGGDIDYAMLVKIYESTSTEEQRDTAPLNVTGAEKTRICGNPDPKNISTSYVERQNLTMRMSMRRFTRLTNGFSKKVENHAYHLALHYMYYNFCRVHKTLRVTPAMEAGIADHVWTLEEIVNLAM